MSLVRERVSYLRGLAEGMQISDATNESKLMKAMIDVIDEIAMAVDEIDEMQAQLSQQMEDVDEDLAHLEKIVYEDDCKGCSCDSSGEEECLCLAQIECPHCSENIDVREEMIDEDGEALECPNCNKKVDIEWNCEDNDN